jgi:hypothetical protein
MLNYGVLDIKTDKNGTLLEGRFISNEGTIEDSFTIEK